LSTPVENWTLSGPVIALEYLLALALALKTVAVASEHENLAVVHEAVDEGGDGYRVAEALPSRPRRSCSSSR